MKILIVGDAACQTGFARVVRQLGDGLHKRGHEVAIHAINFIYDGEPYAYPVWNGAAPGDFLAATSLGPAVNWWGKPTPPDVILVVQDLWNMSEYTRSVASLGIPVVGYSPVDAPYMKWQCGLGAGTLTRLVTYTQFGATQIRDAVQRAVELMTPQLRERTEELQALELGENRVWLHALQRLRREGPIVIPHGQPTISGDLTPDEVRAALGFNERTVAVLAIATNTPRKRLDCLIQAFAKARQSAPQLKLMLHCYGTSAKGWDLDGLLRYYRVEQHAVLIHKKFADMLTEDSLHQIYAAADIQVNTASAEGWGLPNCEGALHGVPQVLNDMPTLREIWGDAAVFVPPACHFFETGIDTYQAMPSPEEFAKTLVALANDPNYRRTMGQAAKRRVEAQWTWDEIVAAFEKVLQEAAAETAPALKWSAV